MSGAYIGADVRRRVLARAERLCEYCLIHEDDTFLGCEIDHIISQKHGGVTEEDNLACACLFCNRNKGSDIASRSPENGELVPLFNPRVDRWLDHFRLANDGVTIVALTPVGEATARILGFNSEDRMQERRTLREVGRYPTGVARRLIFGT